MGIVVITAALYTPHLMSHFQFSSFSSAIPFLEHWLSLPWLCWGVGPLVAVNCGIYMTSFLLELAICKGVSLISYGKVPRKVALSREPGTKDQLVGALTTTAGPAAILNAVLLTGLMTFLVPGPYPVFPDKL
jgi:hypothetical protein